MYDGPAVNVSSWFDVVCESGPVEGSVTAGGDVKCGEVGGSVTADGDVACDAVGSGVQAGGDVHCAGVAVDRQGAVAARYGTWTESARLCG